MLLRHSLIGTTLLLVMGPLSAVASGPEEVPLDPGSGLAIAPGWEMVKTHCTVCHSAKFITFQRGDRDTWASMIRWMQKTQGLWQFDDKTEDIILTYLSKNYPPGKSSRRRNLPPGDLPPNPQ